MKCLVINLDRSVDRLAHVSKEFDKIGVVFERVAGVDAAGGPAAAPLMSAPEVCCVLSHRLCWRIIADGSDPYGAVFEDDVVLAGDAGALLTDGGWVPRDTDLIKLETFFTSVRLGRRHTAVGNGYSLTRLVGGHVGSAGYIISRQAAQRLLRQTRRFKTPVDEILFCPTSLTFALNTIRQLTPALCAQAQHFLGHECPASLIQLSTPDRQKSLLAQIGGEVSRAIGHLRKGTLFGTDKVDAVSFRQAQSASR